MNRLLYKMRRTTLFLFLIVMPIGIRLDPEHPNEFSVSVHGGTGQVVSVLRNCEGNVTSSEESTFTDVAGSMQLSHRFDGGIILAIGARSGKLDSNAEFPSSSYSYEEGGAVYNSYDRSVSYSYFNPYISFESRPVGLGVGYLGEDIPTIFGEDNGNLPVSAHLRFGNYARTHFLFSLNEDLPLASGAGYFKMGIGYPAGSKVRLFTGMSAGFYEDMGFVQQVALPLSSKFDLDLSTRLGTVDGKFAGGVSVGVRYHLPFGTSEMSPEEYQAFEEEANKKPKPVDVR